MRDFVKGIAVTAALFAGLIGTIVATSRPVETLDYARAAARGVCAISKTVTAPACRRLARLRPARSSLARMLHS